MCSRDLDTPADASAGFAETDLKRRRCCKAGSDRCCDLVGGGIAVMSITRQPAQVVGELRCQSCEYFVLPADFVAYLARHRGLLVALLDALGRAYVDQSTITVGKPNEEIRYMVVMAGRAVWPQQCQRLRRDGDNVRGVVGRHQIFALEELFKVDVGTVRARPVQPFVVPLTRPREEPSDRRHALNRYRSDIG